MEYEWEKEIDLDDFVDMLADHLAVVGVCIENKETGEGALIRTPWAPLDGTVICADIWQDIMGDAEAAYRAALEEFWASFRKVRADGPT